MLQVSRPGGTIKPTRSSQYDHSTITVWRAFHGSKKSVCSQRHRKSDARRAGQCHHSRRPPSAGQCGRALCAVRLLHQPARLFSGVHPPDHELERRHPQRHRGGSPGPRDGGRQLDHMEQLWPLEPVFDHPRQRQAPAPRPCFGGGQHSESGRQNGHAGPNAHLSVHRGRAHLPRGGSAGHERAYLCFHDPCPCQPPHAARAARSGLQPAAARPAVRRAHQPAGVLNGADEPLGRGCTSRGIGPRHVRLGRPHLCQPYLRHGGCGLLGLRMLRPVV